MLIARVINDQEIIIDTDSLTMQINWILSNTTIEGKISKYHNLKCLSADLACNIGTGPAKELFTLENIPHDSDLWFLNYDNPWKP